MKEDIPVRLEEVCGAVRSGVDVEYARFLLRWCASEIKRLQGLIAQSGSDEMKRNAGLCSCSTAYDKYCPVHGKNAPV